MKSFDLKYVQMKNQGAIPIDIYLAAKADQLDGISRIRLLRQIFDLSLTEAKEVSIIADGTSLAAHNERIADALEKALADDPEPEKTTHQ